MNDVSAKHAAQRDGTMSFDLTAWPGWFSIVRNEVGNLEGSAQRFEVASMPRAVGRCGTNECQYSLTSMMVSTRW